MINLFSDYLHPVTQWVYLHPHWALLATFLISFSESLAFIGSIIPGTVTMTAFGILAGSGMMRIDLTLLAATLGAIAGDSASYGIGVIFSDRLTNMWPFKRYPQWLRYGQDYFERHGGKSVLIGRFTGPLRSIIPIIAGMMQMNRWHFLVANVTSAIGWALLYVMPGVLIGAASNELSAQSASMLFVVILCFLGMVWAITLGLKWIFIHINQWLHTHLNTYWSSLIRSKSFGKWARYFTPPHEVDHYATATMAILLVSFIVLMPLFFYSYSYSSWAIGINEAVRQFCLSIRTHDFDAFFIVARLDISYLSLLSFSMAIAIYAIYHRDWRLLKFWLSLLITSTLIVIIMSYTLTSPLPVYQLSNLPVFAYPTRGLTFATTLYGFLAFYMAAFYKQTISMFLRILLLTILFFAGIALVYLGEDWLMNVLIAYKIGFTNALFHWMLYRRCSKPHYRSYLPITLSIVLLLIATALSSLLFFHAISERQKPYTKQFDIQYNAWWNQHRSLLSLYSMNRFGKEIGLMNIQYVGSIHSLQQTLEQAGWKKQLDSFFLSLILRLGNQKDVAELPLMAQLYMNQKPFLMMTNGSSRSGNGLILRLWRSNYHVHNKNQIIWIGSIQTQTKTPVKQPSDLVNLLSSTLPLTQYKSKTVIINPKKTRPATATSTILLLIKEKETE